MLLKYLSEIDDKRRKQGQMYRLEYVLFFSILAILSGAVSYREIHSFIKIHLKRLKLLYRLKWKKAPSYGSIRYIIQKVDPLEIENCFRKYTNYLIENNIKDKTKYVSIDGKALKGSFDNFNDKKAIQVLSAFLITDELIIAHKEISDKTNEIPIARFLIKELGLKDCIFTFDALHCQKNFTRNKR